MRDTPAPPQLRLLQHEGAEAREAYRVAQDPSRPEYLSARASEWREYEDRVNTFELPEEHPRGERWTIVAEGQSALDAPPDVVLDGPVVLVNRALHFYEKFGGDVWMVMDRPDAITYQPMLRDAQAKGFEPWGWGQWERMENWLRVPIPRDRVILGVPKRHPDFPLHVKRTHVALRGDFSVHSAICGAILFGAKKIRTIGVDMKGAGDAVNGFLSNLPKEEREWWEGRWRYEQQDMGRLQTMAYRQGITIRPWLAEPQGKV